MTRRAFTVMRMSRCVTNGHKSGCTLKIPIQRCSTPLLVLVLQHRAIKINKYILWTSYWVQATYVV
jgi:hypothetical protein